MGCTSGKQIKKKTTSIEDVSLQKGSAGQTNAAPSSKNGQIAKQSNSIQIPGANKSFLAPDGIPFIDEDVDDDGEQLNTTKISEMNASENLHVGNATPARAGPGGDMVVASTTTTTTPKKSALQGGGDPSIVSYKIETSVERPQVIDQILQKEARTVQHQEPQHSGGTSAEKANAENTSRQQEVAATKIQAGIRGFLDRKKVRAMRARQQNQSSGKPDNNKHHHSGEDIGGGHDRQVLTDRTAIEMRYADASDDPKLNTAATKIQANYKGYKTRKQMKVKK